MEDEYVDDFKDLDYGDLGHESGNVGKHTQDCEVPREEPPVPARAIKLTLEISLPTAPAPVSKSPAPPLAQPKVLIAAKGCKGKVPVKVKAPKGHTQAPIIPGNATDGRRRSTRLSEA
ncbi:hypothetical protein MJO28_009526 [Puccinia striiformis f. sp. tritici]|uniref:Uncharacterized protein n=4 Tax=Puccinia striiformis TaxID=27350 RepID=A0A0L0VSG7_9BASI|nr:hypothetical protein MJO28_009526 [Puccinia striiformis f. sp. tritici]KNF02228.1 hypothetical protein PSTG_04727 [Puccinia striiformis f. sp. tritici PST-78]POV98767.1 hypothetical protein PSTT_14218 [Puccinia striiformis]POW21796.1 hypothetical protein PSHT_02002 [Puccinia striiformis]